MIKTIAPFASLLVLGALGCQGASMPSTGEQFVAFAGSFNGFHNWPHAPATPNDTLPLPPGFVATDGGGFETDGGIHNIGPMTVYWNQAPPSGSTSFPIGTIIVKQTNPDDSGTPQTFGMVKRGADYNPTGAVNWEWFELQDQPDSTESILWRGYGPQMGESYGGNPHVCNDCHLLAISNDYVWTAALQLTNF